MNLQNVTGAISLKKIVTTILFSLTIFFIKKIKTEAPSASFPTSDNNVF